MKLFNLNIKSLLYLLLLISCSIQAQTPKQRELEQRKQEILKEIEKINSLISENKQKEKSIISQVEDINYKVNVRRNLLKVTNQQANLITQQIYQNQKEISELREELEVLKKDYANMIVKSYKSKNEHSKMMFLLSSTNFHQAYKRLQYIKQYANYQKQQGELIKAKTQQLQKTNKQLLVQKAEKQKLIAENEKVQKELEQELNQQENLMQSINKSMSKYAAQIKGKQREADKIDRQIEKIIREAIASSNKEAGKSKSSSSFALTAESKALAASFTSNKGKLPWPVEKGIVKMRYGVQRHPVVKTTTIKSNGVRIATEGAAKVRAVFEGKVLSVQTIRHGNLILLIQHGNYITAYKNLSKVFVKKGDKVSTKQVVGEVFTNSDGETILSFSIFKDSKTQNPAEWIYKM